VNDSLIGIFMIIFNALKVRLFDTGHQFCPATGETYYRFSEEGVGSYLKFVRGKAEKLISHDYSVLWIIRSMHRRFLFRFSKTYDNQHVSRPQEGRSRSSRVSVRDAVDAAWRKTCGMSRTAKPCGPVPPTLGSSEWRYPFAMVAKKPGTPGRARSKP
jgi:hypothetical protein